jgi:hypothetical protein
MHILFVDESGTPPKPTAPNPKPYFIIAGVAMPTNSWPSLSAALVSLKAEAKFRVRGEIKWRFFGEQNPEAVNSVSHLSKEDRNEFRRRFFHLLIDRPEIKVMACVASVKAAYATSYVNTEDDLYEYTYKPVSERFQYQLQELPALDQRQLGLIVCDHRGRKQDERLRNHHHKLMNSSAENFSIYANFIETIPLTPSHQSVGIQFADMVAGAVGRYFNSKDQTFAKMILPCFRKGPSKKINGYGLVKFPKGTWI